MSRSRSSSKRGLIAKLVSIWALALGTLLGAYLFYTSLQGPPPPEPSARSPAAVGTTSDSPPAPAVNRRGPRNRHAPSRHHEPPPPGSDARPAKEPAEPSRSSPDAASTVVKSLQGDGPKTLILHVHEPGWGIRWQADAWYFSVHLKERETSRTLDLIGPVYDEETRGTRHYESTGVIRVKVQAMGDWTVDIVRNP